MTPHQHATGLVAYFSRWANGNPEMAEGLRLASEWLRLLNAENPAVAEIEALAADVEKVEQGGSGILDLKLGVAHWTERARRQAIMRRSTAG
jgi:hypothetical protein